MKKNSSQWDKIYRKKGINYASSLSKWNQVIESLKQNSVKKILDIGCGGGKHLVQLANQGFDVYGIDNSPEALKKAKANLIKKGIKPNLIISDMHKKIPFKENTFDAIISLRTLNHGDLKEITKTFSEINRILKKGGFIFITVQKTVGFRNKLGKSKLNNLKINFIKPRTYIKLESEEEGIIHFVFNKKILIKLLKNFRILKFWIDYGKKEWEKYYCILAKKAN